MILYTALRSWDVIQYVFDEKSQEDVGKKRTSKQGPGKPGESDRERARRLWNADPRGFLSVVRQWQPPTSPYESDLPNPGEPYYEQSEGFDRPGKRPNVSGKQFGLSGEFDEEEFPTKSGGNPGQLDLLEVPNEDQEEAQMRKVAQQSFEDAVPRLVPYLELTNSSGRRDNCLIYSVSGALNKRLSENQITSLGDKLRKNPGLYDHRSNFLHTNAIPNILGELGEDNVRVIVVGQPREQGEEGTFNAEIINPHAQRTIFIVNAVELHFGFGALREGYNCQIIDDTTVKFVRQ
jgi:hypothetical protein